MAQLLTISRTRSLSRIELAAPKSRAAVDPTVLIDASRAAGARSRKAGIRSR